MMDKKFNYTMLYTVNILLLNYLKYHSTDHPFMCDVFCYMARFLAFHFIYFVYTEAEGNS